MSFYITDNIFCLKPYEFDFLLSNKCSNKLKMENKIKSLFPRNYLDKKN